MPRDRYREPWWRREVGGLPIWSIITVGVVVAGLLGFVLVQNLAS